MQCFVSCAFFVPCFEKKRQKKKKKKDRRRKKKKNHCINQGSEKSFYLNFLFNTIVIKLLMHCVHVFLKKQNKTKEKNENKQTKNKQTNKQTNFIVSNSDPGVCSV